MLSALLFGLPLLIGGAILWWKIEERIQRPMSYWEVELLCAAFATPGELARYYNRGSMSRLEWKIAMRNRQISLSNEIRGR